MLDEPTPKRIIRKTRDKTSSAGAQQRRATQGGKARADDRARANSADRPVRKPPPRRPPPQADARGAPERKPKTVGESSVQRPEARRAAEKAELDYEIGFGKPPKKHQFKKGVSGNPKGRPKGSKSDYTYTQEALNKPITISENGKSRTIKAREALPHQLVARALKGDVKALSWLREHMDFSRPVPEPEANVVLSAEDQATLDHLIGRRSV
ncbi:MAG: hypothetical protein JJ911_09255 [Rhizobiaceae bacterium]|nr:hypothetical protein [Rhizobiaceae bacterium]